MKSLDTPLPPFSLLISSFSLHIPPLSPLVHNRRPVGACPQSPVSEAVRWRMELEEQIHEYLTFRTSLSPGQFPPLNLELTDTVWSSSGFASEQACFAILTRWSWMLEILNRTLVLQWGWVESYIHWYLYIESLPVVFNYRVNNI